MQPFNSAWRPNAYMVYMGMRATSAFAFSLVITYELVYHTIAVGLNPLQLVTVGVVLECMTFFFEIPTGVVADLYSRRLSVLIGLALMGVGFLVEGLVATFAAVLAAQVLWGIGFTFYSGAESAWISDEIGEARAGQAFLRAAQIGQISTLAGVGVAALLVNGGANRPLVAGALIYVALAIILLWVMGESGFQPAQREDWSIRRAMLLPLQESIQLVRVRPVLFIILLIGVVIGLCLGGFDRLNAAHFTQDFALPALGPLEPVAWFSMMSGAIGVLSLGGAELVRRRLDLTRHIVIVRLLTGLYSGMLVCMLVFALAHWFWAALICFCVSQALRNTGRPILIIWINQHAEPRNRATLISLYWQSNALGQIVGSPIIGWIGAAFSLRAALATGALVYGLVLPLLRRAGQASTSHVQ